MSEAYAVRSLAVVLPRYGDGLGGGAETLVKSLVDNLLQRRQAEQGSMERVEVWTTCALDHRTWENVLPPGLTDIGGVPVQRFPVDERNLEVFINAELAMQAGRMLGVEEQLNWLAESVNSRALYQHIIDHGQEFDALLFAPYLFATSFWGALIYPERSLLLPCLHNEMYAYQSVFRHVFREVGGLIFNASPELELAQELYQLPDMSKRGTVVGMGFEPVPQASSKFSLDHCGDKVAQLLRSGKPFLLYSGRKEKGKNLDLLLDYFTRFRQESDSTLQLLVIGSGEIHFVDSLPEFVVDLGFVSEAEKALLMEKAFLLCQPSTNESFSIVMMEAWQQGTPVLVHADCAVTQDHVVRSGGGLYFANALEFSEVLKLLETDETLRRKLGEAGRQYVASEYSWDAVRQRFGQALRKFSERRSLPTQKSEEEINSEYAEERTGNPSPSA